MNWEAIAAVGQVIGALAVFLTLAYLARQVRQANCQNLLSSYQHTYDTINQFLQSTLASADLADIVVRGRESYASLNPADRLRFDHFHLIILNVVESHLFQVERTADPLEKDYRAWARENMQGVIQGYFAYPGTRAFWAGIEALFEPAVRHFIAAALQAAPAPEAEPPGPVEPPTAV